MGSLCSVGTVPLSSLDRTPAKQSGLRGSNVRIVLRLLKSSCTSISPGAARSLSLSAPANNSWGLVQWILGRFGVGISLSDCTECQQRYFWRLDLTVTGRSYVRCLLRRPSAHESHASPSSTRIFQCSIVSNEVSGSCRGPLPLQRFLRLSGNHSRRLSGEW